VHYHRLCFFCFTCVLIVSCASVPPASSEGAPQGAVPVNPQSIEASVAEINRAMQAKDMDALRQHLSAQGVSFVLKWPGGADPSRLYTMEVAVDVLRGAVVQGSASCIGYNPNWGETTALAVFSDLNLDWHLVGGSDGGFVFVGFVLRPLDGVWSITSILRVDPVSHVREIVDLEKCPE